MPQTYVLYANISRFFEITSYDKMAGSWSLYFARQHVSFKNVRLLLK